MGGPSEPETVDVEPGDPCPSAGWITARRCPDLRAQTTRSPTWPLRFTPFVLRDRFAQHCNKIGELKLCPDAPVQIYIVHSCPDGSLCRNNTNVNRPRTGRDIAPSLGICPYPLQRGIAARIFMSWVVEAIYHPDVNVESKIIHSHPDGSFYVYIVPRKENR